MPAMSGDLIGLQGIWMPSGFPVAVTPPTPTPTVDQHGDIGARPRTRRPAPTYHEIAVDSRIVLIGRAVAAALVPVAVESRIDVVGAATILPLFLNSRIVASSMAPLAANIAVGVAAAQVESVIMFVGEAQPAQYNERDVRFVLGLP